MDQFDNHHSQLTHPQNTHERPKKLGHHDATPLTLRNDVLRPEEHQVFVSREEELESATANTGMRGSRTQAQVRNASHSQFPHTAVPADASEPVVAPVAMHLQGAYISGNTRLTNVRGDYVINTVNSYGETNGLKELEKFVSFEAQFDSSAQDPNRQCHPGTRTNVLKRLRAWVDNPNSTERIFWLHGPAGAGKSSIAQTIAHSYARPKVAASFFFFRSDISRNDGNRLFTTLAYQLALSMPEIGDLIVHSLSKRPDLPRTNLETQFEQLLVRPFQVLSEDASQQLAPAVYPIIDIVKKYQQLAPVIIIDGVDECTDDDVQRRFLKVIDDAVRDHRFPLRFLIVSRPELHIEQTIRGFQPSTLTVDLAKLDDANRDINKYLVDGFSRIASKQDLDPAWPGQEIIDDIVYKSSGNFIFPSLVIRFVGDPDNIAETQLDIILNIKPPTTTTPFGILDQLFLEILERVPDQVFLKRYLALLVARISASIDHNDDAVLMHVSEKELHAKLRKLRSLLKFERGIGLHHQSFLDFLHDSSRSSHHYVRKQDGMKGYLEVFVDSLVRYVSAVIEQSDHHNVPHFTPRFREMVNRYPPKIELPVKEWQEVLQPLRDLQEKLLQPRTFSPWGRLRCDKCTAFHLMRELLQLGVLKEQSNAASIVDDKWDGNLQKRRSVISPIATTTTNHMGLNDVDSILLALFTSLPETMENFSPNEGVINLMNAILLFDYTETVTRVRSVLDAKKLVNILGYMIHSKYTLHQDAMRNAGLLAFEIFSRVSTDFLPYFFIGNHSPHQCTWHITPHIEILSQTIFASRILDRRYIVPVFGITKAEHGVFIVNGNRGSDVLSMKEWRLQSIPSSVIVIHIMLRLAKAIQYLHLMGVVLYHQILSHDVLLYSNLCPKLRCLCSTSRSLLDKECQEWFSPNDNIFSFGSLFYEMYTGFVIWPEDLINSRKRPSVPEIPEYAWQLIQRCCTEHPKSRPTIDEVVNEMEGWYSIGHVEPDEAVNGVEGLHSVGHAAPDAVNGVEGWRSGGQGRTCFRALGSLLSDIRRNLC